MDRLNIASFVHLLKTARSPEEVVSFLSLAPKLPTYMQIGQFILYHKGDLAETVFERASKVRADVSLFNKDFPVFALSRRYGKQKQLIKGHVFILPGTAPNVFRLTSISTSPFWNYLVSPLVRYLYPKGLRLFFKQSEIEEALKRMEVSLLPKRKITISDTTYSEKKRGGDSRVGRVWVDEPVAETFQEAYEARKSFRSIKLSIEAKSPANRQDVPISSMILYKFGEVRFNHLFDDVSNVLLPSLEQRAEKRLSFMKGRGRLDQFQPGRPIVIDYSREIFANLKELRKFGKIVMRYKHATKALYHANPYFHASLADFQDGSSFDVQILSETKVIIYPQLKTTEQALSRFVSHIFIEFREGEITNYEEG